MKLYIKTEDMYPEIENMCFCEPESRKRIIESSISSRDMTKNMVKVRSSNIWSYGINVRHAGDKTGDVIVQFKGQHGGPDGGLYLYMDVPVQVYRKWVSAPSKGHYFWQHIRNVFKYRHLDGNKRGVLPNAVN